MKKNLALVLAAILIITALAGCGASADNASVREDKSTQMSEASSYDYGESGANYYFAEDSAAQSIAPSSVLQGSDAKLIFTANIELETLEFDAAVASLQSLVESMGGYIQDTSLNGYGTYRYARYTVRIPSDNFGDFCNQAGEGCNRLSFSSSSENISEMYYDLESRLKTQKTKLERLQDLLSKAESMEDIITLETAISETEQTIESYSGSIRGYDALVDYSTVNINLSEIYKLTIVEPAVTGFGARLGVAISTGLKNFTSGIENLLLAIAYHWVGVLIFIVIIAAIIVYAVRIRHKKTTNTETPTKDE